ncbi:peptidylprolyl isomerase [Wohlfahrtiimonas chitiniclastica]|uniref:Peptidyl-prolyl cis-trans isomerase n=2 Tax=Wohlfahrtiimonas chitiniclastica TaxID=400946 RepID=L8XUU0_9GAMM|nr:MULTISPECIES: peptidylprolyl isomerase [Wohlfahrtiimonas]ELV07813.1 Peptidyl-prolyl cis-trans isomerase B [Wohlfahrtiimonas chitiniclastica SH04]KZS23439.1 peptidyl-prolyl cis-trans isomerase [Wohlfahrtiimonas chitiniclastica]KZX36953.1 cyclophilin [Wohlfahrtiimonas chitiniclastica]MBS7815344.1 peptidyl-prolyl cis-trans isomerase [Wohlfahrtiimonas chitiniclastica]MBS7817488.1 peptidyl-prolyl cis-trans isomerase [Wohlfahrtiimonas chitiniclastica]
MIKFHTNQGSFTVELDHENAPVTAENFLQYAKDGFFEGTLFHRVIPGFMVQGGGLEPGMIDKRDGQRAPIQNEANNGLKNVRGSLAMARTMDPHSATNQFFINTVDNGFLNFKSETPQGWGYAVFGKVVDGMDVIDAIEKVETTSRRGHGDVPVEDIIIERVEIID